MLTSQRIATDLRNLGVADGDLLMVHASLRAVGPADGGAAGVVRALEMAVGPHGTLLVLLGARDDWAWVNELPEPERARRLAGTPPFDSLLTPADPEVGVLPEVFRGLAGTLVSDHPEGRFAARGRLAYDLVRDVPWNDYFGPGSPLERLVRNHGRILRLGADPATVTALHFAEYLAVLPVKRRVRRWRVVRSNSGPALRLVECLDDSEGIVDRPGEDYFAIILREYLAAGRTKMGRVGAAASELMDAWDSSSLAGAGWSKTSRGSGPSGDGGLDRTVVHSDVADHDPLHTLGD